MHEQLYEYLNNYYYDLLCGFRKAHSTQYDLSRLITSLEKELDNSGLVYGLDKPSLNLVNGYVFGNKRKKLALRIVTGLLCY